MFSGFLGEELRCGLASAPKLVGLAVAFIEPLGVKSVLDLFAGSGWIAEACERLQIKYLGFEINPAYVPDIKRRIRRGISARKMNLNFFMKRREKVYGRGKQ
ncbi:MAG: DNA methyltransferase [Promethearchaeota archaeon]